MPARKPESTNTRSGYSVSGGGSSRAVAKQNKAAKTYISKGPKSPARVEAGKRAMATIREKAANKGRAQGAAAAGGVAAAVSVAENKRKSNQAKNKLNRMTKKP
jgi:hypothetical protein